MEYERRGGRGDRIGRYGNFHNDHNFQDMDYRDCGQEDEEAGHDIGIDGESLYISDEQPLSIHDVSPGFPQSRPGFHLRRGGRGEASREGKGLLWPPCPQPHSDLPQLQREIDGSRQEFEHFQMGLQERGRGRCGRGFPHSSGSHLGAREGGWHAAPHSESMEFGMGRQREEDRFPCGGAKRRMFPVRIEEHGNSGPDMSIEELDQRDQDYRVDLDQNQRPSNIIMLRMLPPSATASEIRAQLLEQGVQPREVRLMRNKSSGQSRGFAFVEFNLIQEATSWMETNQGALSILGHNVSMHYSNPKPRANEDWLCNKCGVQNFKRREKCFKCSVPKSEAELKLPQMQRDLPAGLQKEGGQGLLPLPVPYHPSGVGVTPGQPIQQTDVANDTLILRNLGPHTSLESIVTALAPFATLTPSNIRLIKDKHTHLNRGFAFLQLSTIVEASQLLQILQALQPPLSIEGKTIVVEFAKGSKRDVFVADGSRVSAATVASTAIAAAQWAVSQNIQGPGGNVDAAVYQQGAAMTYSHDAKEYTGQDGTTFKSQADARAASMSSTAPPLTGVISEAVKTGPAAAQQALPYKPTIATTAATPLITQIEIVGKPQPATPSQPATPGTEHELKQYPVPDVSTYHYDDSSGFYYDPFTGLYYDPNSQYYYNPHSQQYMYWDGEKQTYIHAANQSNTEDSSSSENAASSESQSSASGSKEKKEKPKSKTAQQIAKDMERWAKSLNRQKENMRSGSSSAVGSTSLPPGYTRTPGHGRLDDQRESASADAGYAVLEKKGALSERPQSFLDQLRQSTEQSPPQQHGLVPAYSAETDSEEEGDKEDKEGKMTDWVKLACLLCRRQFPSKEALIRHQQLSELHKQNLEQRRKQLDAVNRERLEPPDSRKRKFNPLEGITGISLGARMLQGGVKRSLLLHNTEIE
ncbi:RNA-binding protein 10 isoform X2 [Oryzias melastigma]|uniref:RNA binding motif protein 10 n=1 Tax=Oryzias melastigma TaxID=30732 RepID=A0A3B3C6D8_ORYME|nr:RNA-binding protein 10 isoform X2 [Oryzias melastigma]